MDLCHSNCIINYIMLGKVYSYILFSFWDGTMCVMAVKMRKLEDDCVRMFYNAGLSCNVLCEPVIQLYVKKMITPGFGM